MPTFSIIKSILVFASILLFTSNISISVFAKDSLLTVTPKKGDGIAILLKRYGLPTTKNMVENFKSTNKKTLDKNGDLILDKSYFLPIKVVKFNGKNIRTSIGNQDRKYAEKVQEFNLLMSSKGLKEDFKKDKILWVPYEEILYETFMTDEELKNIETKSIESKSIESKNTELKNSNKLDTKKTLDTINSDLKVKNNEVEVKNQKSNTKPKKVNSTYIEPLFGKDYQDVKILTNKLRGVTFYLDAGHGGIDPGAVGVYNNSEMHEDEYAYDVTVRFARKLIENGADVYMIVQDKEDGIRDSKLLNNKFDEVYYGDIPITMENKQRLRKRGAIVNELYKKNEYENKLHQLVTIHVDSRITEQRIDIFFYYKNDGGKSQKTANTLLKTIENKYNKAQPGRGYKGSVTNRNLYMLNNTLPPAVYIELGNIQNQLDQVRFLEVNNRQAIANWLCDGFIESYKDKVLNYNENDELEKPNTLKSKKNKTKSKKLKKSKN